MIEGNHIATGEGFSIAAATYDADEEGNPILLWMRRRAEILMQRNFPAGSRLLELGCGTGIEAERLASRGCSLVLTDVATGMLERATAKVERIDGALAGAHLMPASRIGDLVGIYGRGSFDGAYSSFGPLNCEPDARPIAKGLAELVRPGGRVVLSVINAVCPTEILWYAFHLDFRNAFRRLGGPVVARAIPGIAPSVMTWYYTPGDYRRAFSRDFNVLSCRSLPLVIPPPYLGHLMRRFPRSFRLAGRIDDLLAPLPLFRSLGDHFLVEMERRGSEKFDGESQRAKVKRQKNKR